MKGQIIKIVSNLYTVNCSGTIYECHSRGKFRNENITPVVGDYVVIDEKNKYILEVAETQAEIIFYENEKRVQYTGRVFHFY